MVSQSSTVRALRAKLFARMKRRSFHGFAELFHGLAELDRSCLTSKIICSNETALTHSHSRYAIGHSSFALLTVHHPHVIRNVYYCFDSVLSGPVNWPCYFAVNHPIVSQRYSMVLRSLTFIYCWIVIARLFNSVNKSYL